MAKVKVRMNHRGSAAVMNDEGVMDDLLERAERIRDRADSMGRGRYEADVMPGINRAHAMVKTTDYVSRASNAKHNSLLKSLDAGRG